MQKELVVIKQSGCEETGCIEESLRGDGWHVNTIELSKDEPLPRSLENIDGLLILGRSVNVYEQYTYPFLKVYLNT
jgi:hypothetical protein